jgi:hypothetical protein
MVTDMDFDSGPMVAVVVVVVVLSILTQTVRRL